MATLAPDSRIVRRTDLLVNDLSRHELVMLDVEAGSYFGLQGVGKLIWEELATPSTPEDLCGRLLDRFEVEETRCRTEVAAFLDTLQEQGLIDVQDPTGPA
jgi:hypothetical protein